MNFIKNHKTITKYLLLLMASFLLAFTGLKFSVFLVPWIGMIFFIYYFREQNKWYEYLILVILLFLPKFFIVHGGWSMLIETEIIATICTMIPILLALLLDKYFYKKTSSLLLTLVFPATYVIFDLLLGLAPFGTFSSIAISQFDFKPLIQIASITGLAGISFLVFWFSSTVATLWKSKFNFVKEKQLAVTFVVISMVVLLVGGIYFTTSIPTGKTVKIAGITIEHSTDYSNIIDLNTPREEINKYSGEINNLNNILFEKSKKAVDFGVQIIFWSEIQGIIYPENEIAFIKRSSDFAKENKVYFAPAVLSYHYDSTYAENKILMFNPDGKLEYEYEKTISWYSSKSDGFINTINTPYGKIGTIICFDADFPRFIRTVRKENIDILLVPKFDTRMISPGHTYSGSFRGVENGFSVVSQVNEGISIASDYRGNVLSYQDFFTTENNTMVVDVPINGRKTIYSMFGDWFVYLCALFLVILTVTVLRNKKSR
jgi:apolipoprotein N-acyltransferase